MAESALEFNPLNHRILFSTPKRLTSYSAWHEHIPFAMFLVELLQPRVFVELGTHYGDSYCAFCQAVQELDIDSRCYSIDTWTGDAHAGFYGPEVLADLRAHHDPLYGNFSSLIKSTFDDALKNFSDGTIDLLHIDGCHTYEVVKHDFELWLLKMSSRGVVVFHDINTREGDFGVWKLWDEVKNRYPYFEFVHGHGLGVLAVGTDQPVTFKAFLNASSQEILRIRNFFFQLGLRLILKEEQQAQLAAERAQFEQQLQRYKETQQQALVDKGNQIAKLSAAQGRLGEEVGQLRATAQAREQLLRAIEDSLAWILITKYRWLRERCFPEGTARRSAYDSFKGLVKGLFQTRDLLDTPRGGLALKGIRELWSSKVYTSISLRGLTPLSQTTTSSNPDESIRWVSGVRISDEVRTGLLTYPPSSVVYRVSLPARAHFLSHVALMPDAWSRNAAEVIFQLEARNQSGISRLMAKTFVNPTRFPAHRKWVKFKKNLRRFANQEVDIVISTAIPKDSTTDFAWAVWGEPLILCRKPFHQLVSICRAYVRAYGFLGTVRKGINKIRYSVDRQPVPSHNYPTWLDHSNGRPFVFAQTIGEVANSILTLPKEAIERKVSVVIPTRNGMSEDFESTLQAIYQQKGISDLEVIVVDSGSTDSTVQTARDYGAKVLTIPPEEFNHGATRNYAAEQSTGDLLVFMVQDAIPATQDLFHEMAKALLGDEKLAGLSVRQIPKSDADIYACWEMWNHYRFLFEAPLPRLTSPEDFDRLPSQQLRRLAGLDNVCSMVRRELWENSRFKATPFAEDLEFGLSCVKQGYTIGLLPHRGVIHSHTRSAYYSMSRHYIDMLVLLRLFKGESQAKWIEAVNPDQLLSSVRSVYLTIIDFLRSLDKTFRLDPANSVTQLISFLSSNQGLVQRSYDGDGEATLDKFFDILNEVVKNDRAKVNPCQLAFEGTINSLLHFLSDRYPVLEKPEFVSLIYKAYAGAAGSVLGEYSYWQSQRGNRSKQMETLDNLLQGGIAS